MSVCRLLKILPRLLSYNETEGRSGLVMNQLEKATNSWNFIFYFSEKVWLVFSSESSANQKIPIKYQTLFSLTNKK